MPCLEDNDLKWLYTYCRLTLAAVWFYQGLVPKLLGPDHIELQMNMALGLHSVKATQLSYIAGAAEIGFALVLLAFWRSAWPLILSNLSLALLLPYSLWAQPELATSAFSPVITNLPLIVLGFIGLKLLSPARA